MYVNLFRFHTKLPLQIELPLSGLKKYYSFEQLLYIYIIINELIR